MEIWQACVQSGYQQSEFVLRLHISREQLEAAAQQWILFAFGAAENILVKVRLYALEQFRVASCLLSQCCCCCHRVVVDEGHQMGRSSVSNVVQMASALQAERRWVLTGTPTPSLCSSSQASVISHMFRVSRCASVTSVAEGNVPGWCSCWCS